MSTRSIIAKQDGDAWKGRYAHWDGYPTHQGKTLWEIVQRDGYETAVKTLVEDNFYWSALDANHGDTALSESRWVNVKGYGVAGNEEQGSPDEWHTPKDLDDTWCEWVYVIAKSGLLVIYIPNKELIGFYPWNEAEPSWKDIQERAYSDTYEKAEV